jgi:hypothetical protein
MRTINLILALALFSTRISAQQETSAFTDVKNQVTLVVLENDTNSPFSKCLKYAVKKYWTITKYKFITQKEEGTTYKNSMDYTFLGCILFGSTAGDNTAGGSGWSQKELTFYRYQKFNRKTPEFSNISSLPSGYHLYGDQSNFFGKKTDRPGFVNDTGSVVFVVRTIQNMTVKPAGYPFYSDGYGPVTNKKLHGKTLLIPQEDLDSKITGIDEIKAVYPFPVKIVPRAEIRKYMDSKDPTIAYIACGLPTSGVNITYMVTDAESGMYLVLIYDHSGSFLKIKDFKKLAKED